MTVRVTREAEPQIEIYGAYEGELLGGSLNTYNRLTFTPTDDYVIVVPKNDVKRPQLETASTPSSYIPTNGSTVTRAAETLTAPSANLPWWTDNITYLSDELVTNGTFDTDVSGWTASANASLSLSSNSLRITSSADGFAEATQVITGLTVGGQYSFSFDVIAETQSTGDPYYGSVGTNRILSTGTVNTYFTANATSVAVRFGLGGLALAGEYLEVDNISVREIETPAISIAMEGTMTYADNSDFKEVVYFERGGGLQAQITDFLSTNGSDTGQVYFQTAVEGTPYAVFTSPDAYSPGVNVPFSIASRHGYTFINGAVDGTALTENSTPTALPDLSSTDLDIAPDFMGTIKSLRIWSDDLGDEGISEVSA